MTRADALSRLQQHQEHLRALGLAHLSLFGSTARGESGPTSDLDLAVTLADDARIDLFALAAIKTQVSDVLGTAIDMVVEPTRNPRLQAAIDRDRVHVF